MSKKYVKRNTEYSVIYSDRLGADFSGSQRGFSYLENVFRDYEDDPSKLQSVPGFRLVSNFGNFVNSIFIQKCSEGAEYLIVHADTSLFRFNINEIDTVVDPTPIASVKNTKSHAFCKAGALFVFDGEQITKIDSDGSVSTISDEDERAYVPTTYKNCEPYEQRNLLSSYFKEIYTVVDCERHYRESRGLRYALDDSTGTCTVTGIDESFSGPLFIPRYAKFGKKEYSVKRIEDSAFVNVRGITEVHIADGLTEIGKLSFSGCKGITAFYCPSTVELIDNAAFADCTNLKEVFIGKNLKKLGATPFSGISTLESVKLECAQIFAEFIENINAISTYPLSYSEPHPDNHYCVPVKSVAEEILEIHLNGTQIEFSCETDESGIVRNVFFKRDPNEPPEGAEIIAFGKFAAQKYNLYSEGRDFTYYSGGDLGCIAGCKCSAFFNGHIFLSGNPKYPNTVFYSLNGKDAEGDGLYFGSLSYFNDGMASYETVSLSPTKDTLAVLKSSDDGSGGIFYHQIKKEDGLLQLSCPLTSIHTGIGAKSSAVSVLDETVFLSDKGVYALKSTTAENRRAICKSGRINSLLLKNKCEDRASVCSWLGYVVIQLGSEIYLADPVKSRFSDGSDDYEWYYLSGIGTYKDTSYCWKFMPFIPPGYSTPDYSTPVNGAIIQESIPGYGIYFYIRGENDEKYAVYLTDEKNGGTFSEASCIFSNGRLLFFGTKNGDVCVFNNDKRGVAPQKLTSKSDFNQDEYTLAMGNKIHPEFYDFCGKRPRYVIKTKLDNCELPHLKKRTVKDSLVLKLGLIGTSRIKCEIVSDSGKIWDAGYHSASALDFSNINFEEFSFECIGDSTVNLRCPSEGWAEQQICIISDGFKAPIAVSSVSYRYKIKGKPSRS